MVVLINTISKCAARLTVLDAYYLRFRPPYRRQSESMAPDREATPPGPGAGNAHALDSDRSPLPTDAPQLTQMVAMFWNTRTVLNAGNELRQAKDEGSKQEVRDGVSQV